MGDSWVVGIATRNRSDTLACCLSALLAQDVKPECLVVVDQSDRPVSETLAGVLWACGLVMPVVYRPTAERGLWRGREAVIEVAAQAEVLVMLDDDMLLCGGALRALIEVVEDYPFAVGTHLAADLRTGWTQPSQLGLREPVDGPEHHWYVDRKPFLVSGSLFADAFVAVRMEYLKAAVLRVRRLSFYQDVLDGVGRSDRLFAAMIGVDGVGVPRARAVHISPTAGELGSSGGRAADWVEKRVREELYGA